RKARLQVLPSFASLPRVATRTIQSEAPSPTTVFPPVPLCTSEPAVPSAGSPPTASESPLALGALPPCAGSAGVTSTAALAPTVAVLPPLPVVLGAFAGFLPLEPRRAPLPCPALRAEALPSAP